MIILTLSERVLQIFISFKRNNPEPKTELHYSNAFELIVAVILSAQSTDKQVNIVTKELFALANSAAAMHELPLITISRTIKSLGLYHKKAQYIKATSAMLLSMYQGNIPDKRLLLEQLPGVGQKTAGVVLNVLFKHNTIAIDTHVWRVSRRLGLVTSTSMHAAEQELLRVIPADYHQHAHSWLVLHGRYVCTARTPSCQSCHIREYCLNPANTDVDNRNESI
jgi:endonuclease-3